VDLDDVAGSSPMMLHKLEVIGEPPVNRAESARESIIFITGQATYCSSSLFSVELVQ
jgi:hypothetical protein